MSSTDKFGPNSDWRAGTQISTADGKPAYVQSVQIVDSAGVSTGVLPSGTDRSGTAATSSGALAAANTARRGMNVQNIGANNIGVNEFGGAAAIGTAGTYTLTPGSSMNIRTNRAITVIAATGATAYSATEW